MTKRQRRAQVSASFRPRTLAEVVGQTEAVADLKRAVAGAKERGDMPGHILLTGPAGTGKTTLALCIANEMGGRLIELFGTGLRSSSNLLTPLVNMERRDVLFIDEIHRMTRPAQESLYPVMEDGRLPLPNAQMVTLPRIKGQLGFTLIGATTDPQRLTTPMLDRFARILRLRLYTVPELVLIASRAAYTLGVEITGQASESIAKAADGVPRVVIRLVRAARDYAEHGRITPASVNAVVSSPALVWRTEGRDAG